jgi:hypothetical protein
MNTLDFTQKSYNISANSLLQKNENAVNFAASYGKFLHLLIVIRFRFKPPSSECEEALL